MKLPRVLDTSDDLRHARFLIQSVTIKPSVVPYKTVNSILKSERNTACYLVSNNIDWRLT